MSFQVPKDIQEKLGRFEQLKAQLQAIMGQRSEMEAKVRELEEAASALAGDGKEAVYRRIGDLMFKVDNRDALRKELEESRETLSVRLSSMLKQETNLKEMYEKLGTEINEAIKG
ncbi:MAG: prefoldin subunit beta [Candidatus Thermoplasmatota archaeon]|nr:prefoldin subunit beta [Candidatus Thermoplasmatota archaeon]